MKGTLVGSSLPMLTLTRDLLRSRALKRSYKEENSLFVGIDIVRKGLGLA
jgi:hypothetical protein